MDNQLRSALIAYIQYMKEADPEFFAPEGAFEAFEEIHPRRGEREERRRREGAPRVLPDVRSIPHARGDAPPEWPESHPGPVGPGASVVWPAGPRQCTRNSTRRSKCASMKPHE